MQERDVPETDGRDERHRRMPLRGKDKTDELSVLIISISGVSVCAIRLGLRSLEDGRLPRRMAPRRMLLRRMFPRQMALRRMSPRRMPLRRMSPRRMAPRRMPLTRMSPRRRKTETEEDRDGCPRDRRCVVVVEARLEWLLLSD